MCSRICSDHVCACVCACVCIVVMELLHMDEYVDQLLTQERVCDVILPRIQVW